MYLFEDLLENYKAIWWQHALAYLESEKENPSIIRAYMNKQHIKKNDRSFIQLKKDLLHLFKQHQEATELTETEKAKIKESIISFFSTTLGISRRDCQILDQEGYYEMTLAFMDRAKALDPDFTFEDIFQALRNVWVMISLQIYLDQTVVLTDSIFAYSMLYPLTDNYLDDPTVEKQEKQTFNQRFYEKIKNNHGEGKNASEARIFSMIDLIETQYNRQDYPEIYMALLAILDGQNKSLDQQDMKTLYDIDLLSYTFYKGGTSVLADAYLVKGTLEHQEAMFAYGYGVILQLADDLQDLEEDLQSGHHTMINTQARLSQLDHFHRHYEALINYFLLEQYNPSSPKRRSLHALLVASIEQLMFSAVLENKAYFSKAYLEDYMSTSRFSEKGYKKLSHKLQRAMMAYY